MSNLFSTPNKISLQSDPKTSLRIDNNIFTQSKESVYLKPYSGGRTGTATVTIDKDNVIYADVDADFIYMESYLEDNIFYC